MIQCSDCLKAANGNCGKHEPGSIISGGWSQMDTAYVQQIEAENAKLRAEVDRLEKANFIAGGDLSAALLQISEIKAALLKYCYCGDSGLPSVDAEGRAGTAPTADTCRIHYALGDIACIEGKTLKPKCDCGVESNRSKAPHALNCALKRKEEQQKDKFEPGWFLDQES